MSARESLALWICVFDGTELPTPLLVEGFKVHPHSSSRPLCFVVPVVTVKVSCLALLLQQDGQVPRSFSRNSCCNYFWNFVPQGFPEQIAPLLRNFSWFSSAHRKSQNFLAWLRAPLPFWGPSPLPPSISLIYWLVYLFILWPVFLNVSNVHFLYWRVEMVC